MGEQVLRQQWAGVNDMELKTPLYMDYHATTPVDPRVVQAMLPYFTETFGNAASIDHLHGGDAQQAVQTARETIARIIGAHDSFYGSR